MNKVYNNLSGESSVRNAFHLLPKPPTEILIACPFFSDIDLVNHLLDKRCSIKMIVRLGPITSASALLNLCQREGVQIRYFTSNKFHSKLYIFGQSTALVGSANLTGSGMVSNQEIAIAIEANDERFEILIKLFQYYWDQAEVLTIERARKFLALTNSIRNQAQDPVENAVLKQFGEVTPAGVQVGIERPSKDRVYSESYRRVYQEFLNAYNLVLKIYRSDGRRQQPEDVVPLRIEVDQFFNYIREMHTRGDSYLDEPILYGNDLEEKVEKYVKLWFEQRWEYLDKIIPGQYKKINDAFGDSRKIQNASAEDIFDGLDVCHSVHERLRFFPGGHKKQKETFLEENEIDQLRKVITYLLFGKDSFIDRMGRCIFDEEYSLSQFGRSAVQELIGWVNKDDIPICNGRTVKALRFLGFTITVFN